MFISGMLPAGAEADTVDRYTRLVATGDVTFTPEGRTKVSDIVGAELVVDAVGTVIDRIPFKAKAFDRPLAASLARVPCVHDSTREGFTPYTPPVQYPIDNKNEKGMFKFHFYSVDKARINSLNQPTVQFLGCAAGGVDAENGSRITISGPGVAFNDPNTSYILGQRWREGKTPEDYSITLGFEVPVRGVNITGSIQQDPSNSLRGSILPPFSGHYMAHFHENGVNAWWEDGCRPRCTRFGGSNHYQGSVGEGLWEFPQWYKGDVLNRGFKIAGYMEHFCANPFGC
ncbi:MAG: hypothetical protein ACRDZ3_21245 [Acidimicrobiia bacterium]